MRSSIPRDFTYTLWHGSPRWMSIISHLFRRKHSDHVPVTGRRYLQINRLQEKKECWIQTQHLRQHSFLPRISVIDAEACFLSSSPEALPQSYIFSTTDSLNLPLMDTETAVNTVLVRDLHRSFIYGRIQGWQASVQRIQHGTTVRHLYDDLHLCRVSPNPGRPPSALPPDRKSHS